jgi:TonB family protein
MIAILPTQAPEPTPPAHLYRSEKYYSTHYQLMKLPLTSIVIGSLLLAACSTPSSTSTASPAARPDTPGLPFGDYHYPKPEQVDQKPVPTFMPSPFALRAEFIKKKLSGDAVIGFTITPEGKTTGIKIVQSSNSELAQLSAAYVARMVFRPAKTGGSPVACDVEMPFFQK